MSAKEEAFDAREAPSLESLATLGRQAASMAHELANVLTSILGWTQVALQDPADAARVANALKTIEASSRRARRILRDTLDAARTEGVRRPTLVQDVVDDALRQLEQELRRASVRVARAHAPVPEVNVDRGAILQVLVNLLLNAMQATVAGGEVQIGVRPERGGVTIDVADDGPGMTEEVARRAFDPFFTTKTPEGAGGSGGHGLGLAIARRLAEQHGGDLTVATAPGAGSTFSLWLPIGTPTAAEEPPAGALGARPARIVVIDDQPDIRELLATALALRGHTVETAADAAAGLAAAARADVSLVLLDYYLPGTRGSDVLARLRHLRPELPVLFMSGRTGVESDEQLAMGVAATGWLRKPFDLDDVYREVDRLLGTT